MHFSAGQGFVQIWEGVWPTGLYLPMASSWWQSQACSLCAYSQQHLYDAKKERLKIQEFRGKQHVHELNSCRKHARTNSSCSSPWRVTTSHLWDATPSRSTTHQKFMPVSEAEEGVPPTETLSCFDKHEHIWFLPRVHLAIFFAFCPKQSASGSSFRGHGALQICWGQLRNNSAPKDGDEAGTTVSKQPHQDYEAGNGSIWGVLQPHLSPKISPIVSWHWTFPLILVLSGASKNEAETGLFLPTEGMEISRAGHTCSDCCLLNPNECWKPNQHLNWIISRIFL